MATRADLGFLSGPLTRQRKMYLKGVSSASVTNPSPKVPSCPSGPEASQAVQAQTLSTPTQTQTETLPPRPAPTPFTTRISLRTHLRHKYTLPTHALPLSGRDLQHRPLCPAHSPGARSPAPMEISSNHNLTDTGMLCSLTDTLS